MSLSARRLALTSALALGVASCGAKTGLHVPPLPDGGRDASRDGATSTDAGSDAFVPASWCVELAPMAPPRELVVDYVARILDADVYFLVDVTGSMGGEISTIQSRIQDTIAPGIFAAIPHVRLSLGRFADYPFEPSGTSDDEVFRLVEPSTSDLATFVAATHRLSLQSGGDPPEAYVPALYLSAAGRGIANLVPGPSCPSGTVGYPCFSRGGSRIIVLFTDAEAHDGPGGSNPYSSSISPAPPTYNETVSALRAIGAKVISIFSGTPDDGNGLDDVTALARDTGAVTSDGRPLVFPIGGDGTGLDDGVIDAVQRLVTDVPIDVDLLIEDAPGDDVDVTTFVRGIVTNGATPASDATDRGDHFEAVHPGTEVSFRILLANALIAQTNIVQRFRMRVILRGDGVTQLEVREVDLVVPALGGAGCD